MGEVCVNQLVSGIQGAKTLFDTALTFYNVTDTVLTWKMYMTNNGVKFLYKHGILGSQCCDAVFFPNPLDLNTNGVAYNFEVFTDDKNVENMIPVELFGYVRKSVADTFSGSFMNA